MGLPGVNISIANGQLGSTPGSDDSVMGLLAGGVAADGLALSTPKAIYSLKDAEDLGIDATYDSDNSLFVHEQIKQFYSKAGTGKELWIMLVSNATTMEDMVDPTLTFAPTLLEAAEGRIRMLGVIMDHDNSYVAAYTNGFDDDAYAAILKAQELYSSYKNRNIPLRIIIEGRDFQGDETALTNLREGTQNAVGCVLDGLAEGEIAAAVGRALGKFASLPVQRNIGRVKDGDLNLTQAYFSDGNPIEDYSEAQWGVMHDRGYLITRKFLGRSGYFYADDPAATVVTDDYAFLARGRVIDKAQRLAYITYLNELLDDLEVDQESGQLNPAVIKSYQATIETVINTEMTNNGEISGIRVIIDPLQNILSTNKVAVKLRITPKGYSKNIDVDLGFENPALNN